MSEYVHKKSFLGRSRLVDLVGFGSYERFDEQLFLKHFWKEGNAFHIIEDKLWTELKYEVLFDRTPTAKSTDGAKFFIEN